MGSILSRNEPSQKPGTIHVGFLKFRGTYTVSTSGAEYDGTTVAEILDTAGNVLTSVTVINGGQRIHVELQ